MWGSGRLFLYNYREIKFLYQSLGSQCLPLNSLHQTGCMGILGREHRTQEHFSSVSKLIHMVPPNLREYRVGSVEESGSGEEILYVERPIRVIVWSRIAYLGPGYREGWAKKSQLIFLLTAF